MFFEIEPSSPIPIYSQLTDQLRMAVASGRLEPGQKLPGSRPLAKELQINLHTVNKAYQQLVQEGILEQKRGRGTFVSENPSVASDKQAKKQMEEQVRKLCRDANAYNLSLDDLKQLVEEHWNHEYQQDTNDEA